METTRLVQTLQASSKYRHVCPALMARIGARELAVRKTFKEAVKETKNRLHQIAGAYLDSRPRYETWLAELSSAQAEGAPAGRAVCRKIMEHHASTRERLPILETFYTTMLAELPPIRCALDVACGLNPLAIPWMPLAPDAAYFACDIHTDQTQFLNRLFPLFGIDGVAETRDVIADPPPQTADLALVLKLLPVLEQQEKGSDLRLLRALKARYLLVSFPTRSLGGRGKGMTENYAARFLAMTATENWALKRFEFATELAFLVAKPE
jgi:16S rRNA (guanine(1405)-N(7))-methyltransferase